MYVCIKRNERTTNDGYIFSDDDPLLLSLFVVQVCDARDDAITTNAWLIISYFAAKSININFSLLFGNRMQFYKQLFYYPLFYCADPFKIFINSILK